MTQIEGTAPAPRVCAAAHTSALRGPVGRGAGLAGMALLLVLCALASIVYGSVDIGWGTAVSAFTAFDGSNEHVIIRELRVPRTLLAIAVGAALALSGALMQGLTRNPLAEPGILGINAGAALAVVCAIFLLGVSTVAGYVWFAFAGAAASAVAVYMLGSVGGRTGPVTLALAGTVLAALLGSATSAILVLDVDSLDRFRFWVVGSLAGRDLGVLASVAPFLIVGTVIALLCGRSLNALALGEDVARSLGQRVALTRAAVAIAVVLLAGGAAAAAGPIAFVGLAVPHAVRLLVGGDWRWVLAYCALAGPVLMLAADVAGRLLVRPAELQVGIVTALIGAPLFVAIARRRRMSEL